MNHKEVLSSAVGILKDRAVQYGPEEDCFGRISQLASIVLNKPISPYDVAMILHCTKLGRLQENRTNPDNYVDGINYLAFGGQFAGLQTSVVTAAEDDIAALARKFAPVKKDAYPKVNEPEVTIKAPEPNPPAEGSA